jgi:hypothetical protein
MAEQDLADVPVEDGFRSNACKLINITQRREFAKLEVSTLGLILSSLSHRHFVVFCQL